MRPTVVVRKRLTGNRIEAGAEAHAVLPGPIQPLCRLGRPIQVA